MPLIVDVQAIPERLRFVDLEEAYQHSVGNA